MYCEEDEDQKQVVEIEDTHKKRRNFIFCDSFSGKIHRGEAQKKINTHPFTFSSTMTNLLKQNTTIFSI